MMIVTVGMLSTGARWSVPLQVFRRVSGGTSFMTSAIHEYGAGFAYGLKFFALCLLDVVGTLVVVVVVGFGIVIFMPAAPVLSSCSTALCRTMSGNGTAGDRVLT